MKNKRLCDLSHEEVDKVMTEFAKENGWSIKACSEENFLNIEIHYLPDKNGKCDNSPFRLSIFGEYIEPITPLQINSYFNYRDGDAEEYDTTYLFNDYNIEEVLKIIKNLCNLKSTGFNERVLSNIKDKTEYWEEQIGLLKQNIDKYKYYNNLIKEKNERYSK